MVTCSAHLAKRSAQVGTAAQGGSNPFESGEWLIPETHSKTGQSHTVYLSRQIRKTFSGNLEISLETRPWSCQVAKA